MKNYLSLIKFSHTIFALPFAMIGFVLGIVSGNGKFYWTDLILVLGCMVFGRSAAMAFNRYIDRDIDKLNIRTASREIPAGIISGSRVLLFVILNCIAFIVCTGLLNMLCLWLSPVALLIILGYSYTKRFTWLCHFVLGLGLSLAPIGAYIAVTEHFNTLPILFSMAVLTWVSGFDIIYALQDEEFDNTQKLFSIPAAIGKKNALIVSNCVHGITAILIIITGVNGPFSFLYFIGVTIFISMLIYQHIIIKPNNLSKVNLAFFTTNGIASVIFGIFTITDLLI
ncbi:MAG TPA: UbiA-like polyprenyltransferase [Chitinophagales bacterium]|nr:UbiA-like polyprenyltransferase [Chitinophagales bacterium]